MIKKRFVISGGGTGGHIFPAIAIGNKIKKEIPEAEILFIGAKNKMEMKLVPKAGFEIVGLDISGISRSFSWKGMVNNLKLPFVLWQSLKKAKKILRQFKPDVVIGVGGYASASALRAAFSLKIPTLIQEQNSYPGITNKLLAKKVNIICTAYDHLEKYFPQEKIVKTGNPIREEIISIIPKDERGYHFFHLDSHKKTILVVGGSLGAHSINQALLAHLNELSQMNIQLIWQTGESFYTHLSPELLNNLPDKIKILPFIHQMNLAYSIADIIISRAGALAISEISTVGIPAILIPFPYAAEDHQTKNAQALVNENAALMISDAEVKEKLFPMLSQLINNENECETLKNNIKHFAQPNAIQLIYQEILNI